MAAEVDICNLALGHLGDVANVAVINPPDGSAQSEHCQRFYPLARDTLLEMNDWTFATRRATLAAVTSPASTWQYAYAMPTGALNFLAVLDPAAQDDYSTGIGTSPYSYETMSAGPLIDRGMYTPQDFAIETDLNGSEIVLTNQVNAVGRFVIRITDTSKFSNLFVDALAWLLASHLAGPVLKGAAGTAAAKACAEVFQGRFTMACNSDSGQRKTSTRSRHAVSWINGR
jgi:hypothetical protein